MLSYNANRSGAPNTPNQPNVPVHTALSAETVALRGGGQQDMPGWGWSWASRARVANLEDTLPKCCCFFTEVLLICHGSQGAVVSFITGTLAKVIGGRPVEKFVFWSCRSGDLFMPGTQAYEQFCAGFRPRMCGCGCTAGACMAFDPDLGQRHCPDGTQSTTIITSGQYDGKSTSVGLAPSTSPPVQNPFQSPDGQVRTITIAPDTAPPANDQATATVGPPGNPPASVPLIGGAGTSSDPNAPPPNNAAGAAKKIAQMQRPSKVGRTNTPWSGPTMNLALCQPSEGCIPGAGASQPQ
jgi:hypothetical protein